MKPKFRDGFTLLETLVSLSIFVIAITIVTSYIVTNYEAGRFGQEQNEAIENARKGIETMITEIREGGTSGQGGYMILENLPQSLKFYSDVDRDGTLEQIHYWLDGTNFKKGTTEPNADEEYLEANEVTATLSQYVRNGTEAVFIYYNADYPINMASNPLSYEPIYIDDIRLVDIYLKINVDPLKAPGDYILRSKAQIRTLKDNL
jgi:prepilin-type N-terminal cleavage/methylation domain-containing protein